MFLFNTFVIGSSFNGLYWRIFLALLIEFLSCADCHRAIGSPYWDLRLNILKSFSGSSSKLFPTRIGLTAALNGWYNYGCKISASDKLIGVFSTYSTIDVFKVNVFST